MASCRNDGHPEEFNRLLEDWLTQHTYPYTSRNRIIHLEEMKLILPNLLSVTLM
jgi:hypothetical protein